MTTLRTHRWTAPPQRLGRTLLPALTALLALRSLRVDIDDLIKLPQRRRQPAGGGPAGVALRPSGGRCPDQPEGGPGDAEGSPNGGPVEHELLVFKSDLDPAQYPADSDGNIKEDGAGITKVSDGDNIAVGGSQTRTVDLTQPGKYLFVCNIPSHYKQGMAPRWSRLPNDPDIDGRRHCQRPQLWHPRAELELTQEGADEAYPPASATGQQRPATS